MKESIQAEPTTLPNLNFTKTGKEYGLCSLNWQNKIIKAYIWIPHKDPIYQIIKPNKLLNFTGNFKTHFNGDELFNVHYVQDPEQKEKSFDKIKYILSIYGSLENYRDSRITHEKDLIKHGLITLADGRVISKEYCIEIDGKWMLKIDYIMDILGPDCVTQILKKELGNEILTKVSKTYALQYQNIVQNLLKVIEEINPSNI